jgi:hypothetical protein
MTQMSEEERTLLNVKMNEWQIFYGSEAIGVINGLAEENKDDPADYPIDQIVDMMERRLEEKLGHKKKNVYEALSFQRCTKNPLTEPANHELSVLLRELKYGRPFSEQLALECWAKIADKRDYSGFGRPE